MKNFIIIFCVIFGLLLPCYGEEGKDLSVCDYIYQSLQTVPNNFINNEDPYEYLNYQRYYISPYPLLRTWSDLYFKELTIPKGYYLLNPRKKNGQDVVLFKQRGKVAFIIPVFEKIKIDMKTFYPDPPKPKTHWYGWPWRMFKKGMAKLFGLNKTPPQLPKSFIKTFYINETYFEIDLYYEDYLYKTLFKLEKDPKII